MAAVAFFSLSEWSFTIYPTPYNRKENVLSVSLNKAFLCFIPGLTLIYDLSFETKPVEHIVIRLQIARCILLSCVDDSAEFILLSLS